MTVYTLDGIAPQISEDTWIAQDANVIGKIVIEEGVGIWFGCTLRGDNEVIHIGKGSNVQENAVLHTDMGYPLTVGENCTIGHMALLHGCQIGNNTLIGMGAMVMNGAKIGNNCLIGANALVTEGKVIPDGSLVLGAPGKVVRQLDEAAKQSLTQSALGYQESMRRFRTGMRPM